MQQRFLIPLGILLAFSVLLPVGTFAIASSNAQSVPTFTGDAQVDFVGPDVIQIDDPSSNVGVPDVGLPAPPFTATQISGWDMNAAYMEYDFASDTMYVGIDCLGICGDADGDGDPGASSPELIEVQGTDHPNLSGTEAFTFLIDTDNDCQPGVGGGDFEVVIGVALGADSSTFGAFEFSGTPFNPSTGFGAQLTNAVSVYAEPSAAAPDIEFSVANFSTLPGFNFTPGEDFDFQINVFMGSLEDDGIGEDYLPGTAECVPVNQPGPTPTPAPTETPTEVPTETPTPTDTPTPEPTATNTATPPPPTVPPVTGPSADSSQAESARAVASADTPIMGLDRDFAPQRLNIPAIGLDAVVEPMGWFSVIGSEGEVSSEWNVVDYAAGWHANSALPNESGNVILSGHNNMGGAIFENLHQIRSGDTVSIWQNDQQHWYKVSQAVIVPELDADADQRAQNAAYMDKHGDDRLTLITCWPAFNNTHRLIVVAHKVPNINSNIY